MFERNYDKISTALKLGIKPERNIFFINYIKIKYGAGENEMKN